MKLLLLNFYESPENFHLEESFIRVFDKLNFRLDIIHNFENDYDFLKTAKSAKGFKKYFSDIDINSLKGYDAVISIDIPWHKDKSMLFYLEIMKSISVAKIMVFNHLIPADGHSDGYNFFEEKKLFLLFDRTYFLEFDSKNNFPRLKKEAFRLREYSIDTFYYSPFICPKNRKFMIFSAGSKGRNYSELLNAVKNFNIDLIIFSNSQIKIPKRIKPHIELKKFNANLRFFKKHIANSDLVIIPIDSSESNPTAGMAITFIAMSMAKPVIVRETLWLKKYIKNGYNGFFYKEFSSFILKEMIKSAMSDKNELNRIGLNARKTAVEKFSMDREVYKIVEENFKI